LDPYISFGKKKKGFKSEVVGDMNASPHEGSLKETRDDFLEVHASIQVKDVCDEVEKNVVANTP